jgi:hypothetical protein
MSNPQLIQEAYYALGWHEQDLGRQLDWKERREFLIRYVEHKEQELAEKNDTE